MFFLHLKSQQQLGETRLYFDAAAKAAFTLFHVLPHLFPPSFLQAATTVLPNERKIRLSGVTKGVHLCTFSTMQHFLLNLRGITLHKKPLTDCL